MINKEKFERANNQNLQNLWQNVEYRNFPLAAINYITSDISICADARMCWIQLFAMAYYDESWTIQISKNELKEKLKRSYGSIGRYLTDLEEKGYITIENVRVNGVWLPSKITVTVPDELRVLLENCPTRKKGAKTSLKLVVNNSTKKDSDKLHVEHESTKKERTNIEHKDVHKKEGGMIRSDLSKNNKKYNI
ncbi:MAG: hypothetical protein HRT87_11715, partial [Legionellales bacterium]|nr:hypothetical protein [Legionellales bacterium]